MVKTRKGREMKPPPPVAARQPFPTDTARLFFSRPAQAALDRSDRLRLSADELLGHPWMMSTAHSAAASENAAAYKTPRQLGAAGFPPAGGGSSSVSPTASSTCNKTAPLPPPFADTTAARGGRGLLPHLASVVSLPGTPSQDGADGDDDGDDDGDGSAHSSSEGARGLPTGVNLQPAVKRGGAPLKRPAQGFSQVDLLLTGARSSPLAGVVYAKPGDSSPTSTLRFSAAYARPLGVGGSYGSNNNFSVGGGSSNSSSRNSIEKMAQQHQMAAAGADAAASAEDLLLLPGTTFGSNIRRLPTVEPSLSPALLAGRVSVWQAPPHAFVSSSSSNPSEGVRGGAATREQNPEQGGGVRRGLAYDSRLNLKRAVSFANISEEEGGPPSSCGATALTARPSPSPPALARVRPGGRRGSVGTLQLSGDIIAGSKGVSSEVATLRRLAAGGGRLSATTNGNAPLPPLSPVRRKADASQHLITTVWGAYGDEVLARRSSSSALAAGPAAPPELVETCSTCLNTSGRANSSTAGGATRGRGEETKKGVVAGGALSRAISAMISRLRGGLRQPPPPPRRHAAEAPPRARITAVAAGGDGRYDR